MSGRGAERILATIEWLADAARPVAFAEVVRALDLPKSSALALLRTLVAAGYVERRPDGRYLLVRLPGEPSASRQPQGTLVRHAEPHLHAAVRASEESGYLAVMADDFTVRYILKILPEREIRYDRDITAPRLAHQVASGIVLLGRLSDAEVAAYAEAERRAGRYDGPADRLVATVAEARTRGLHYVPTGVYEGAGGLAAGIRGRDGSLVAAANLSGPADRVARAVDRLGTLVGECAREISKSLGWDGDRPSRTASLDKTPQSEETT